MTTYEATIMAKEENILKVRPVDLLCSGARKYSQSHLNHMAWEKENWMLSPEVGDPEKT